MADEKIKISELTKASSIKSGAVAVGLSETGGEAQQLPIGSLLTRLDSNVTTLQQGKADKAATDEIASNLESLRDSLNSQMATKAQVKAIEQTLSQLEAALAKKAESGDVTAQTAAVNSALEAIRTRLTSVENNKVDKSYVDQQDGKLQTAIEKKADKTSVSDLDGKLTTLSNRMDSKVDKGEITELEQSIDAFQASINSKASKKDLAALQTEVANKADKSALAKKVDVAQGRTNADKVLGINSEGNVVPVEMKGGNTINVGKPVSGYHTLATAIASVDGNKRALGACITYMAGEGVWETKQFIGTSLSQWSNSDYWANFGGGGSGNGFYNLDNEKPLKGGETYTIETAVEALAKDSKLEASTKNGMIVMFYDGGQWKIYQYQLTYSTDDPSAQTNFANVDNWKELESGSGGGGGGAASRIVLRKITADMATKVGEEVMLKFKFDHVEGEGDDAQSTGNTGTATITATRSGTRESFTRTFAPGEHTLDMTRYCGLGTTTIRVQMTVDTGEAIQTSAISWTIAQANLSLTTDLEGYTIVQQGTIIRASYTLDSGSSDMKSIVCYVDGVKYGEDTKGTAISSGTFEIQTASLNVGSHTLQIRAEMNGMYSNLIYAVIGVYNATYAQPLVSGVFDLPDGSTIFQPIDTPELKVKQYEVVKIGYGAYLLNEQYVNVSLKETTSDTTLASADNGRTSGEFVIRVKSSGTVSYTLGTTDGTVLLPFKIVAEARNIGVERPSGATLFLDAAGNSNDNTNRDTWVDTDNNITAVLTDFTWSGDGWVDDGLRVMNNARVDVGYKPWKRSSTNGVAVGFKYKCSSVQDENAPVIKCVDSAGSGFVITPTQVGVVQSYGTDNEKYLTSMMTAPDQVYDVQFVVYGEGQNNADQQKNYRMVYIVIDGIISGGYRYAEGSSPLQPLAADIIMGAEGATLDVYRVWAYERALNNDEMLSCFILDNDDDVDFMLDKVEENAILDVTGEVTPASVPDGMRVMILTGKATYDGTEMASVLAAARNNVKGDYFPLTEILTYVKGDSDRSKNFVYRPNGSGDKDIRLQGTSSLAYPVKNYRIYTKKGTMYVGINPEAAFGESGELVSNSKFGMHDNSAPVNVWCLKADYAESSSSHNTGMARMVNDTLAAMAVMTPAQANVDKTTYPYEVRTTVDGEPCLLFYRANLSDSPIFLGKFNFNNDKSTEAVYGFTGIDGYHDVAPLNDIENTDTRFLVQQYHDLHKNEEGYEPMGDLTECWEFKNNEDAMGMFLNDDFTTRVTDDKGNESPQWMGTFEARYPDEDEINTDMTDGTIVPHYLSRLVKWVKSTKDDPDKFRDELHYYFDIEHLCSYFSFTQLMACLDQMVKNMMMGFWYDPNAEDGGSDRMGKVRAYMIFYDNDTILGVINNGRLEAPYDVTRQTVQLVQGGSNVYYYAGHDSVLWNNLQAEFPNEIRNAYAKMRNNLSTDQLFSYFDEKQSSKFCERVYNLDSINKYVSPTGMAESSVAEYRDLMQGSRKTHRKYFIDNRLLLLDNEYYAGNFVSGSNRIWYKGISPAGSSISFTLAKDGHVQATADASDPDFFKVYSAQANTETTITKNTESAIGTIINIYGVRMMKKLDISQWNIDQFQYGERSANDTAKHFPYLEEYIFNEYVEPENTEE